MFKRLTAILLFIAIVAGGLVITNLGNATHAASEDWVCRWYTGGEIECRAKTDLGNLQVNILTGATGTLLQSMTFGSVLDATGIADWGIDGVKEWERTTLTNFNNLSPCVAAAGNKCTKFFFQPDQSKARNYPVFCYVDGDGNLSDGGDEGCLHFASQNPLLAYHAGANAALSGVPADGPNWYPVGGVQNADQPAVNNECSVVKTGNCKPHNKPDFNEAGLDATAFTQNIEAIQALDQLKALCNSEAPLPFIFCPIFEGVISGISSLIGGQGTSGNRDGLLIRFLTIQPLSTSSPTVLSAMLSGVITIANLFYVVIFLLIIFSSSLPLGLDNYTIKKMLPKFIAAVIMTQFAYVICGIVVDFFNLLGVIVPNILFSLPLGTNLPTPGGAGGVTPGEIIQSGLQGAVLVNFAAGAVLFVSTVGWILILVLAIIALVAIVVAFIYIVLRYLIIYILILLSPLAFAAWVLPGTEKFFYNWWKNYIRVNAVFPMITGMLAVSIILARVLVTQGAGAGGTGSPADPALAFIGLVLPIVALFLIPKTLKWTTQGMNALAAGALGFAAGKMGAGASAVGKGAKAGANKAKSAGKEAANDYRTKKASEMFGKGNKTGAALLLGNLPTEKGRLKTSQTAAAVKEERRKNNQSAINNVGVSLQGLDFQAGAQPLEAQLAQRGLSQAEASKQAALIRRAMSSHPPGTIDNGNALYEAELRSVAAGGTSALLGVNTASREMQVAAISEMGQRGSWGDIRDLTSSGAVSQDVFVEGIQPSFADAVTKAPDIVKGGRGPAFDNISAEKISQLDHSSVNELVQHYQTAPPPGATPQQITDHANMRAHIESEVRKMHADPRLSGALDRRAKAHLTSLGVTDAAGNPLTFD